jgi:hypothetical protein
MGMQHELHLEVPFPGVRNKIELKVPIRVNSGVTEFNPDAPRASLDLPPYVVSRPSPTTRSDAGSGSTSRVNIMTGMLTRSQADELALHHWWHSLENGSAWPGGVS